MPHHDSPESTPSDHVDRDATVDSGPVVSFFRFIEQARLPIRADKSALRTLSTRAFQYCEPVRQASGYGYHMFPPIGFSLRWDGNQIEWRYQGGPDWAPLRTVQFPNFATSFDKAAPTDCRGFSPTFLSALAEPGLVQVWTGFAVRTAPGWGVLVRPLANLPSSQQFDVFEGIVETDRWFGPIFSNLRLKRTNETIEFDPNYPLFQVQPVPHSAHAEAILSRYEIVPSMAALTEDEWDAYRRTVVIPNKNPERGRGEYAADVRKRARGQPASGKGGKSA